METSSQSGDTEIAEELLRFFVEKKEKECFAAMLYTCYELIKPDVAMEVGSLLAVLGAVCACQKLPNLIQAPRFGSSLLRLRPDAAAG